MSGEYPQDSMTKGITVLAIIVAAMSLSGACSSWREITVRITEGELQERISKRFPIVKSHQILGSITYENPHISLHREDNLVELGVDIAVSNITINGSSLRGSVLMTAALEYNVEQKALFLRDPQLQQFTLNGVPEQNVQMLSGLLLPAIEKILKRKPVYRLEDQDILPKITGKLVKDIRVSGGSLEIVWGI